ncbi:nucleotide binding protein FliI [Legionella birminghamensis]|uniref:protein-secreting ATPase n=1 Tax=Legionella birminghamensis TaxID=28083 RepID=A0A378I8C9_9GAMM|nr:FliI/YscN family ATPase [Legionella birminghamensis]KTC68307.1 nucleotide binding protein FliI [Legionella birminghamensis]STX30980.1 nucleotide binding protein FliI [Legionella birminghamensis]
MKNWSDFLQPIERFGEIEQSLGLQLVAKGPPQVFVGEICDILDSNQQLVTQAEVIGFNQGKVYLLPFSNTGIAMGFKVRALGRACTIPIGDHLLGQVVDAFANPLKVDSQALFFDHYEVSGQAINPVTREPVTEGLMTGIHALDCLIPLGRGQRMGIFAGSGVGKSVLMGMMTRQIQSDINVIALIGERGREVNDFIAEHFDESNRQKSVMVVACSDESALRRRQAIFTATSIAEYFCRQRKQVALFVDSITRLAMAQREIGLSLGEPPTSRGYTPSVFAMLPGLVERAGNFSDRGSITALYTVLVEGDDFNEPIADTMRSLLDGHIILTRELAQRGHFPAIDVLQSVSRLKDRLVSTPQNELIRKLIRLFALHQQHKDLLELGGYQSGSNQELDYAIARIEPLRKLFAQQKEEAPLALPVLLARIQEILS